MTRLGLRRPDGEIDLIFFTETVEDASARILRLHGGDEFNLTPSGARAANDAENSG